MKVGTVAGAPATVGDNGEPPVKREPLVVGDQLHIGIPRWVTKDSGMDVNLL